MNSTLYIHIFPFITIHIAIKKTRVQKKKQASAASKILEHRRDIRSCNLQPSPRPCLEMLKSDLKHIL